MSAHPPKIVGLPAFDVWSQELYVKLLLHLHGQSPTDHFISAFIGKDQSGTYGPAFRRNKNQKIGSAIASTWKTIVEKPDKPYTVALLPYTNYPSSTWLAWDFDFHDHPKDSLNGDMRRNLQVFKREALQLKERGICYIIEHSGRGWHCWLISRTSLTANEWKHIRRQVERNADFTCKPEVFPCFTGAGKGCRAPGSANISTWHPTREDYLINLIHEETTQLLELDNKEISLFSSSNTEALDPSTSDLPSCDYLSDLVTQFNICAPSSRHNQTLRLIGQGCFQFGRSRLLNAADDLYRQANPKCSSSLEEHREDARLIYEGAIAKLVLLRLSPAESAAFNLLKNQSEREVFIIIQNFARLGNGEFFFSSKRVGANIGLSFQRIVQIRNSFAEAGIMKKISASYVPGRRALRYRWLLR